MHRALGSRGDRAAAAADEPRGFAGGQGAWHPGCGARAAALASVTRLCSSPAGSAWPPVVCFSASDTCPPGAVARELEASVSCPPPPPCSHQERPLLSLVLLVSQVVLLSFVPLEAQMLLLPRVSWVQLLSQVPLFCGCHECCWFLGATLVLGATGVSAVGVMSAALVLGPTGGSVATLALGAALATSVTGAAALAVSVTGPAGVSCSTLVLGAAGAQVPLMSQVLPVSWVPLGSHVPSCPGCPGVLGAAFVLGAILAIGAFLATSVTDVASVSGSEARALRSQRSESVKCANLPCTEFLMAPVDVTSKGHLFQKELVGKCREGPASSHKRATPAQLHWLPPHIGLRAGTLWMEPPRSPSRPLAPRPRPVPAPRDIVGTESSCSEPVEPLGRPLPRVPDREWSALGQAGSPRRGARPHKTQLGSELASAYLGSRARALPRRAQDAENCRHAPCKARPSRKKSRDLFCTRSAQGSEEAKASEVCSDFGLAEQGIEPGRLPHGEQRTGG
ncbi:hypothetical protein R6Z07F_002708 [Ovis aries]